MWVCNNVSILPIYSLPGTFIWHVSHIIYVYACVRKTKTCFQNKVIPTPRIPTFDLSDIRVCTVYAVVRPRMYSMAKL